MASVVLVSKAGVEFSVSSVTAFVNAVYASGAMPKTGSVYDNYEHLQSAAPPPTGSPNQNVTLAQLQDLLADKADSPVLDNDLPARLSETALRGAFGSLDGDNVWAGVQDFTGATVLGIDGGGGGGAVDSVNGETGVVVLDAADVGAQPAGDYATATDLSTGLALKVNSSTYTAGLADKADADHDHTSADIADFTTAVQAVPGFGEGGSGGGGGGGVLTEQAGAYAAGSLYIGTTDPGTVPDGAVWINPAGTDSARLRQVSYSLAVLADSPAGFWRLDEPFGLPQDASGNGHHATAVNGTPTYLGEGVTLERASSESISVPDADGLDVADTWTIEAWVRNVPDTADTKAVLSKGPSAPILVLFRDNVGGLTNNVPTFNASQVAGLRGANGGVPADGQWHQIVGTKVGNDVHVYLDGVLNEQAWFPGDGVTTASTDQPLMIGADLNVTPGDHFDGDVKWISYYPTALSADRVAAHYRAGI